MGTMSTKRTAKALKAKAVTKAARKPQKPASCAVTEIARQQIRLVNAIGLITEARDKNKSDSQEYRRLDARWSLLNDRMVSNRDAASYLTPRTPMGAAFILLSMYQDAANMSDEPNTGMRGFYFRRFERSAWALRRFIARELGVNVHMRWGWHYMGGLDPVDAVRQETSR
jgi:hypothetical protein